MRGFLDIVKEWTEIPFAVNKALEDHEACSGGDGRQEEKNTGTECAGKTSRRQSEERRDICKEIWAEDLYSRFSSTCVIMKMMVVDKITLGWRIN